MTAAPIALSLGDPAGVGPEIIAGAWRALRTTGPVFAVSGDAASLRRAGAPTLSIETLTKAAACFADALPVVDQPLARAVAPGAPDPAAAAAIIAWIETAASLALAGKAGAVVTAPIAKSLLYGAGFRFAGHTEFLADLTGGARPVMMLTASGLRCALVTIHEPISKVSGLLSPKAIVAAGLTTHAALKQDFGIERPRLAVAALNPHAGESGALGDEEARIIGPAIDQLKAAGVEASGPHSADSLFHAEARENYDAALCMYHDQALIPVKMLDFWRGVNVTLGLPIVRTSPDHGVAYDLAGKGRARPDSLIAAIRLAAEIAARRASQ
ncbi:MAG TPA: 4-hydroxythreonine-4-phosphate dehydrogenase PdxA [Caulobacteraceae bacterium]